MTPSPVESPPAAALSSGKYWSNAKFWALVLLVFAVQALFLFWLGARHFPPAKKFAAASVIQLSSSSTNELFALSDPTMFALPHDENFSGAAWLKRSELSFHPTDWTEPAKPLLLDISNLGTVFTQFMRTNSTRSADVASPLVPEPFTPEPATLRPIAKPSALRIEGDIAARQLITPIVLPPQTNSDLLPNTELQVVVNAQGNVLSCVVLRGSGSADADHFAMDQAKHARFAVLKPGGDPANDPVSLGKMIFEWQTVPAATNSAPPIASP